MAAWPKSSTAAVPAAPKAGAGENFVFVGSIVMMPWRGGLPWCLCRDTDRDLSSARECSVGHASRVSSVVLAVFRAATAETLRVGDLDVFVVSRVIVCSCSGSTVDVCPCVLPRNDAAQHSGVDMLTPVAAAFGVGDLVSRVAATFGVGDLVSRSLASGDMVGYPCVAAFFPRDAEFAILASLRLFARWTPFCRVRCSGPLYVRSREASRACPAEARRETVRVALGGGNAFALQLGAAAPSQKTFPSGVLNGQAG